MSNRLCLGGHLECTGINPCPACFKIISVRVLLPAMRAGNFTGTKEQAQAFFDAHTKAWKTMLQGVMNEMEKLKSGVPVPETTAPETTEAPQFVSTSSDESKATSSDESKVTTLKRGGSKPLRGEVRIMAEEEAKKISSPGKSLENASNETAAIEDKH